MTETGTAHMRTWEPGRSLGWQPGGLAPSRARRGRPRARREPGASAAGPGHGAPRGARRSQQAAGKALRCSSGLVAGCITRHCGPPCQRRGQRPAAARRDPYADGPAALPASRPRTRVDRIADRAARENFAARILPNRRIARASPSARFGAIRSTRPRTARTRPRHVPPGRPAGPGGGSESPDAERPAVACSDGAAGVATDADCDTELETL